MNDSFQFTLTGKTVTTTAGNGLSQTVATDLDGNGVIDLNDYNAAKRRVGTRLPGR